jgi:hypothetical protein
MIVLKKMEACGTKRIMVGDCAAEAGQSRDRASKGNIMLCQDQATQTHRTRTYTANTSRVTAE